MQPSYLRANLMICNLKFIKDVFLKIVAWDYVFLLLVLKLYPIQVVISFPLWIKLIMDQLLLQMIELCSSTYLKQLLYKLSGSGFESTSDFAPASSKEFLDIEATIKYGFTLKRGRDMTRTYSQMHRAGKYSGHSSIIWPVWPNG